MIPTMQKPATPTPASDLIRAAPRVAANRHELDEAGWAALAACLGAEPGLDLLALWAGQDHVHAAFRRSGEAMVIATVAAPAGRYAALSPARPAAAWYERAIADLWGLVAEGGSDPRPWLDHGRWPVTKPMAAYPASIGGETPQPVFLPLKGEGLHQLPLGPILAEGGPAHLRCHVLGERVLRLEARLGYGHKGVLEQLQGKSPQVAARIVARISAEATVAHSWAFALAAETITETPAPPRAALLRAVMAENERLASHLSGWGATCRAAGFGWADARCGLLRENLLRANEQAFGHRLLMDRVVPGGVSVDIASGGTDAILVALAVMEQELPPLQAAYDDHASLQDRLGGVGQVTQAMAVALAADGLIGRAAGRDTDTRRDTPYAPYDSLGFSVPLLQAGDADARLRLLLREMLESLGLIRAALARLEPGPILVALPDRPGEAVGLVESARGEVLHWLALDETGLIRGCFPRDPAWHHWPVLEAAMVGQPLCDLALCRASFNATVAGMDL
jgi:Ni,Fe-hydrogenase III large subunit